MNPYTPPTHPTEADGYVPESNWEPCEHPHYDLVLRMVLWGEERDDIFRSLRVNGVSSEMADRLYAHAMAERISTIRGECTRKLLFGAALVLAAVFAFSICWFGFRMIPRILLYACFAALGIGSWKFIDGLAGYLMAASKSGSATENT